MRMVSTTQIIGQSAAPAEPGVEIANPDPVAIAAQAGRAEAELTVLPKADRPALDPTRYGDWEKNGRCIDF
jgi:hypothetical protein